MTKETLERANEIESELCGLRKGLEILPGVKCPVMPMFRQLNVLWELFKKDADTALKDKIQELNDEFEGL